MSQIYYYVMSQMCTTDMSTNHTITVWLPNVALNWTARLDFLFSVAITGMEENFQLK